MIKPITLVALVGALNAPSFADQLKAGVALPPEPAAAVSRPLLYGEAGANDPTAMFADLPWAEAEANLLYVGHGYTYEGGEGGEGGEGRKGYYYEYEYEYEGGEGGEGGEGRGPYHHAPGPVHAGLPPLAVPCGSKEFAGTLLGGALGGLLGSQYGKGDERVAAVAAGTFLGMFFGREIGAYLDVTDVGCARDAAQRAGTVPIGTQVSWNNPETGHFGTITPIREGPSDTTGRYCREYQQTVTIGGKTEQAYGTACRQPDGSWQIDN